jgi:hypothetical protein
VRGDPGNSPFFGECHKVLQAVFGIAKLETEGSAQSQVLKHGLS